MLFNNGMFYPSEEFASERSETNYEATTTIVEKQQPSSPEAPSTDLVVSGESVRGHAIPSIIINHPTEEK